MTRIREKDDLVGVIDGIVLQYWMKWLVGVNVEIVVNGMDTLMFVKSRHLQSNRLIRQHSRGHLLQLNVHFR